MNSQTDRIDEPDPKQSGSLSVSSASPMSSQPLNSQLDTRDLDLNMPIPAEDSRYISSYKLEGKVALITGGDSGIGRAVALLYAREGADIAIIHLNDYEDAAQTKRQIEQLGRRCLTIAGDIGSELFCQQSIQAVIETFGKLDILVNNAAEQHPQESIENISTEQLERTFRTNIFSMFYLTQAALPHLKAGSTIINTTSVTAYKGNSLLLDYSTTKGAIVAQGYFILNV